VILFGTGVRFAGARFAMGTFAMSRSNAAVRSSGFVLPRVMGHRGAAGRAPENTLAGLRRAAELGLRWVEFDVMLTRDAVPVLFHDDSLKRTTGRAAAMAETDYADLAKLDAGAWFGSDFAGEPVPSLSAALALLRDCGLQPNMEIKPTPGRDEETAAVALEVLKGEWPASLPAPLVSSFSRKALRVARDAAPDLPRGLISVRLPRDWRRAMDSLGCATLHLAGRHLSPRRVKRITAAGYGLAAFTINDPAEARALIASGVECLISDYPDRIARSLG